VAFRETATSFEHAKTAFALSEAHRTVACTKCHVNKVYKGLKFAACTDCHTDPHRQQFASACVTCHAGPTWKTERSARQDRFPLVGKHAGAQCASCHKQPPMRAKLELPSAPAATLTRNGEFHRLRGLSRRPSAAASTTWQGRSSRSPTARRGPCLLPQGASTGGPRRNRTVSFRGLTAACASTTDVAGSSARLLGCHGTQDFRVAFRHRAGRSAPASTATSRAKCHGSEVSQDRASRSRGEPTYRGLGTACATCLPRRHLGSSAQAPVATASGAKFAASASPREPGSRRWKAIAWSAPTTRASPARFSGNRHRSAVQGRLAECRACLGCALGQLGPRCETCHTPTAFKLASYTHQGDPEFHTAKHAALQCQSCHKPEEGVYPGGSGVAVRFAGMTSACASYFRITRGTLGARAIVPHGSSGQGLARLPQVDDVPARLPPCGPMRVLPHQQRNQDPGRC
jgi:hypothetical protein